MENYINIALKQNWFKCHICSDMYILDIKQVDKRFPLICCKCNILIPYYNLKIHELFNKYFGRYSIIDNISIKAKNRHLDQIYDLERRINMIRGFIINA